MEIEIGRGKKARQAYGFDDIAIVPSRRTRDPDDIDISWKLGPYQFELPMLASAMDGVVSPRTAGIIGSLGGLAVLNLEGIFTRYEDAEEQLERIASLPKEIATREMQEIYAEPVKPELIAQRISEIKEQKVVVAASLTPQRVIDYHEIAMEAGLDVLVIQGTVVSGEHVSTSPSRSTSRSSSPRSMYPSSSAACASYHTGLHLMRTGAAGVLVGVGPGRRLYDPRGARHRRSPGNRHSRRRTCPLDPHARDGRVLPGDRRRRHAQRRRRLQGDRTRRGRRHDRLAARPRLRGAGAGLSLGHGHLPPNTPARRARGDDARTGRSKRSSSGPPARTTGPSTSSGACVPRWPHAVTRISRSSTEPRW